MSKWENILNEFIKEYENEEYVIGAVLGGSYATGNNTEKSDIDIHIITKEIGWKERGNKIIDDVMIEYFINPISEIYKYMDDDHNRRKRMSTSSMFGYGKIIFDKTGEIQKLQSKALEYYEMEFSSPEPIEIMFNNYMCWDLMDELKDKINNKENIELNYYMLLKELISAYFYKNNIATVPFTKIEKIFKNKNYREQYHLKNFPNEEFVNLVINCFDNKDYLSIEKLYEYVIKDFKISDFLLRTEL
ncbi:MAG: hypothetical protein E7157_00880 [Lactobacillales bacterium]|nr:hypothetical protein [Lactobacillales bacterium]